MRRHVISSLIGIVILAFIFGGLESDLHAIPPDFGSYCRNADIEQRDETHVANLPAPPPGVDRQFEVDLMPQERELDSLLDWNQLSPRLGIGMNGTRDVETYSRRLGAGWYIDWTVQSRHAAKRPEHWQMVRLGRGCVYPSDEAIRWLAEYYLGNVWIIGNEPDNIWQDNITPEEYAQVYNRLYSLIKLTDPSAQVAVGGVTQATPLRLQYLDRVLIAYRALYDEPMPVDWWTVHGFVLREEQGNWGAEIPVGFPSVRQGILYDIEDMGNVEYFQEHIFAFRDWMSENGYRDKPLGIIEFGISFFSEYGYTPDVVAQYLWDTFSWLDEARDDQIGYPDDDNHLVQRWVWYSLYSNYYSTSNLANLPDDALTEIGQAFRVFAENQVP